MENLINIKEVDNVTIYNARVYYGELIHLPSKDVQCSRALSVYLLSLVVTLSLFWNSLSANLNSRTLCIIAVRQAPHRTALIDFNLKNFKIKLKP